MMPSGECGMLGGGGPSYGPSRGDPLIVGSRTPGAAGPFIVGRRHGEQGGEFPAPARVGDEPARKGPIRREVHSCRRARPTGVRRKGHPRVRGEDSPWGTRRRFLSGFYEDSAYQPPAIIIIIVITSSLSSSSTVIVS